MASGVEGAINDLTRAIQAQDRTLERRLERIADCLKEGTEAVSSCVSVLEEIKDALVTLASCVGTESGAHDQEFHSLTTHKVTGE